MGEKPGFAERIGNFLTSPINSQPGDSKLKTAARFGYLVASPVVVGPGVLAGFAMDEIHDLGHIREISKGFGDMERTRTHLSPIWSHPSSPPPIPKIAPIKLNPIKLGSPPPPRRILSMPEVPRLKLRMPTLGQSLQHRPPMLKAPTLHLTHATKAAMSFMPHPSPTVNRMRLNVPSIRPAMPMRRPFHPANAFRPSMPAFRR